MLDEVKELQTKAVKEIIKTIDIKDEITFKAPTGSGKTYMMANLMDQVLAKDDGVIFLVSSLSKGELAEQNYQKFMEYAEKKMFTHINSYLINSEIAGENALHIPTDYNVYVLPRDLYRDKSKLKQGALVKFLRATTESAPLGLNKKIYLIKDECHIATKNLDDLSDEYFSKTINCSATPKLSRGQTPDVELKETDAINAHLIKSVKYEKETETLNVALDKFETTKKEYNNKLGINPCLIIQISNKEKADEELKEIFDVLRMANHQDLKWMLIVDKDKDCDTNDFFKKKNIPVSKWKEYAKESTATIDIIIFKMVITEGWDIPRACMLYQIRDSKSKQLDEQVIGRVRRNPKLLDFENLKNDEKELVSTAFVWGLVGSEVKRMQEVQVKQGINSELKLKTTKLKRPSVSKTFDFKKFIDESPKRVVPKSIFELYAIYNNSSSETKKICGQYIKNNNDYQGWFKVANNVLALEKETKKMICCYDKSMEIVKDDNGNDKETSIPSTTYFTETNNYENITDWLWKRTDGSNEFSFDSESEKEWAKKLLELREKKANNHNSRLIKDINGIYIFGKNYLSNSEIRYEYYMDGEIHASYPDFILKDYNDNIHVFESKCINESASLNINKDEYESKIKALKECYKYASKLTGYSFYIPIKDESEWKIWYMTNGNEPTLISQNKFVEIIEGNKK